MKQPLDKWPCGTHIRVYAAVLMAAAALAAPASAHAQARLDTVGVRTGGVGVHALGGAFVGRFDVHGGPVTELGGVRGGIGFGEILQLTGFYWRGIDRDERELEADQAYGGEARFALNTGFGVAPFVSLGAARLDLEGAEARTAAIVGAGLTLPLGPVILSAFAHDYVLGVTGLDRAGVEDVTHNWLLGAGVTIGLGRGRRSEPIVVARAGPAPGAAAVPGAPAADTPAAAAAAAAPDVVRNYQSERTIEVPIPLEGSITLRYGPDRTGAGESVQARTDAERDVTAAAAAPPAARAPGVGTSAADIAAITEDPLLRAWLRQVIGQELALQLRAVTPGATAAAPTVVAPALTGELTAAGVQRALDNAVATLLVRLEAGEAQRMNLLREDLRQALTAQLDVTRREIARLESRLAAAPLTAAPAAPPAATPPAATPPPAAAAPPAVAPPVAQPAPADPAASAAAALLRADAEIRIALADAAARHPQLLGTAETVRGPAAVLADVAFVPGQPLVGEDARPALRRLAEIVRGQPDRVVYVHGHTDAEGPELQNQRLSELRAEVVRSLLVQEGLEPERVIAVGFGEGRPIADNATAAGRALNRRVEIVVGDARAGLDPGAAIGARSESARRMYSQEQNR